MSARDVLATGEKWAIRIGGPEPCWIAPWSGDPGRTRDLSAALLWDKVSATHAMRGLRARHRERDFRLERVGLTVEVET